MQPIYKRIIIKLSGESLADTKNSTILDKEKLSRIAEVIQSIHDLGVEIGVVVGAGNIWRGRLASTIGIEPSTADYMGMLGTIMNGLAVQSAVEERGLRCRVMSSINVPQVCEPYIRRKALSHLGKGIVTIFAGGTGNPYFTTDTNASLRALELNVDAILMAKNGADGVYDSDPKTNPNAKMFESITFGEVVSRKLGVMDLTAAAMLDGKNVVVRVYNANDPENFKRVVMGEKVGTIIK
ncbi:MAG: UMP kinase [Bacilli bacterium]|nr:UMP kinase [Bacilli bacterium]